MAVNWGVRGRGGGILGRWQGGWLKCVDGLAVRRVSYSETLSRHGELNNNLNEFEVTASLRH